MIPTLAKSKISRLQLASEAEQASLSLTRSQMFFHDAAHPGNVKCLKKSYTINFLNIWTPKKFVVITLKFELCGSTIE